MPHSIARPVQILWFWIASILPALAMSATQAAAALKHDVSSFTENLTVCTAPGEAA